MINNILIIARSNSNKHQYPIFNMRNLYSFHLDPPLEDSLHNNSHVQNNYKISKYQIGSIFTIIIPHINIKMHSASSRFNSITLYTAVVLAIMCLVNFAHGYYIFNPKVDAKFEINSVANFVDTKQWQQASIKYSLNADLSPLYTWNLKQLYVYIEFEWADKKTNLTSRTIVTDWILELPEDKSNLKKAWTINEQQNSRMEYLFRDVHHGLRGNTVKVSLNAEYMPIVGIFFKCRLFETTYVMPEKYTNEK